MKDHLEPQYGHGQMHGQTSFVGPAYRMVELPVGTESKNRPITEYTPDWAHISYVKVADRAVLERVRDAGHEYEGYVRIKWKRYSAFTSGGENPDGGDGCIIVRDRKSRIVQ